MPLVSPQSVNVQFNDHFFLFPFLFASAISSNLELMSSIRMHSLGAWQVWQRTLILWGEDDRIISYKLAVVSTEITT